MMMTLDEAIQHCKEKSDCTECGAEHKQLAEWLRELKERRELSIGWIPVEERLPEDNKYILMSFENFSAPFVGRYEEDEEGGAFCLGDEDGSCVSYGLFVSAWMPLPEPYKQEK